MPERLDRPNASGGTTDHSDWVTSLRSEAYSLDYLATLGDSPNYETRASVLRREAMSLRLAADLLESHDETGISLDLWENARQFVEQFLPEPILENGV